MELDIYELVMFFHILGGMGLFAGLVIEALAVERLALANHILQVRDWASASAIALRTSMASMLVLLIAGLVMMAVRWGPTSWAITALIALIVMALVSQIVSRPRLSQLAGGPAHGGDAQLAPGLTTRGADSQLSVSVWLRIGIVVGTLGLMTTKPSILPGVVILLIATLLGAGLGMLLARQSSAKPEHDSAAG